MTWLESQVTSHNHAFLYLWWRKSNHNIGAGKLGWIGMPIWLTIKYTKISMMKLSKVWSIWVSFRNKRIKEIDGPFRLLAANRVSLVYSVAHLLANFAPTKRFFVCCNKFFLPPFVLFCRNWGGMCVVFYLFFIFFTILLFLFHVAWNLELIRVMILMISFYYLEFG